MSYLFKIILLEISIIFFCSSNERSTFNSSIEYENIFILTSTLMLHCMPLVSSFASFFLFTVFYSHYSYYCYCCYCYMHYVRTSAFFLNLLDNHIPAISLKLEFLSHLPYICVPVCMFVCARTKVW